MNETYYDVIEYLENNEEYELDDINEIFNLLNIDEVYNEYK